MVWCVCIDLSLNSYGNRLSATTCMSNLQESLYRDAGKEPRHLIRAVSEKAPHHRKSELPLHKSKCLGRNFGPRTKSAEWKRIKSKIYAIHVWGSSVTPYFFYLLRRHRSLKSLPKKCDRRTIQNSFEANSVSQWQRVQNQAHWLHCRCGFFCLISL